MNGEVVDRGTRPGGTGWSRRPLPRRLVPALVTLLLGAALGVVSMTAAPDPAGACPWPTRPDGNGGCIVNPGGGRPGTTRPGRPGGPGGTGDPGDGNGGTYEPPPCPDWRPLGGYDSVPPHIRPYDWAEAPEGATFYYDACSSPNGFGPGSSTMWVPPGGEAPAPPPPTPGEVAEGLWVEIQDTLLRPDPVTSPELGDPAVIDVPTFVAVSNWQGEISRSRCVQGVCVSLTATPTLRFDPGEPGADAIECDPPGTYFDPDGPSPDEQASVPGACAHAYQRRTGVGDRPDAWPGEVSVAWDVQWQETGGGTSGAFDLTLSTEVPRVVQEVNTVVEDVD